MQDDLDRAAAFIEAGIARAAMREATVARIASGATEVCREILQATFGLDVPRSVLLPDMVEGARLAIAEAERCTAKLGFDPATLPLDQITGAEEMLGSAIAKKASDHILARRRERADYAAGIARANPPIG